jgi:hypothetical protein
MVRATLFPDQMKKNPRSNKLLIILPFWDGDKSDAMHLARLFADMQPGPGVSTEADFLFVCRFDSSQDQATINYVSRKFKVYTYTSKRRGTGWPNGCSDLFFGCMEYFYRMMEAGKIPHYKAGFMMESDVIPLATDAVGQLSAIWDGLPPVCVAGAWLPNGVSPGLGHINGGACLLSGDLNFLKWLATRAQSRGGGWDYLLAPEFSKRGWKDIPRIRSHWKQQVTEESFLREKSSGTLFLHGSKGNIGVNLCRKHLLGQT